MAEPRLGLLDYLRSGLAGPGLENHLCRPPALKHARSGLVPDVKECRVGHRAGEAAGATDRANVRRCPVLGLP